jgi:hypothetical protein
LVNIDRHASTPADRPDTDVTIEDAPAVLTIGISAAGEGGHAPMIPQIDGARKLSIPWGAERRQATVRLRPIASASIPAPTA